MHALIERQHGCTMIIVIWHGRKGLATRSLPRAPHVFVEFQRSTQGSFKKMTAWSNQRHVLCRPCRIAIADMRRASRIVDPRSDINESVYNRDQCCVKLSLKTSN